MERGRLVAVLFLSVISVGHVSAGSRFKSVAKVLVEYFRASGDKNDSLPGLLVSNETDILHLSQSSGRITSLYHNAGSSIVGLAVSLEDGFMFWSDNSDRNKGIYRASLEGYNVTRIVSSVLEVNGLTVDWVSKLVYWTDAQTQMISVVDFHGKYEKVLVYTGLQNPRGIVADPINGYLYWNDQGTGNLERSRLDGTGREVILSGATWPNQIFIDPTKRILMWVDAWQQQLNILNMNDGQNATTIDLSPLTRDHAVYGVALHSGTAYVSTWMGEVINVYSVNGSYEMQHVATDLTSDVLFSMASLDNAYQPTAKQSSQENTKGCSHLNLPNSDISYRCACPTRSGLTLAANGTTCQEPSTVLVYALADRGIVGFMDADHTTQHDLAVVAYSSRPVGVAYDPVAKFVYWSDLQERNIQRARLDGSDHKVVLNISDGIGHVDGLFVDYVNRKLYFTNADFVEMSGTAFSWHRIEAADIDNWTERRVITSKVEQPRGLWVDMQQGYLYFSDWGTDPVVTRTALDGYGPIEMYNVYDPLDNPNSIFYEGNTLYVLDSHYKTSDKSAALYATNTFPRNLTKIVSQPNLQIPYSMAKNGELLYISDWGRNTIVAFHSKTGKETILLSDVQEPMGLFVSPTSVQLQEENKCDSVDCSNMCFASPSSDSTGYYCQCSSYDAKMPERAACIEPTNYAMVADFDGIRVKGFDSSTDIYTLYQANKYTSSITALVMDTNNTDHFYFSDTSKGTIHFASGSSDRANLEKTWHLNKVVDHLFLEATTRRLYWTGYETGEIGFIDLTSSNITTLFINLDKPRSIVVAPNGLIIWSEVGNDARVVIADQAADNNDIVTAEDMKALVKREMRQFTQPNSVTLDPDQHDIFYVTDPAERKIFKCNLTDGTCLEVVNLGAVASAYSMQVLAGYGFVTDWNTGTLYLANLETGSFSRYASGFVRPSQFAISFRDHLNAYCYGNPCEQRCMPFPGGWQCACNEGYRLRNNGIQCYPIPDKSTTIHAEATTGQFTEKPVVPVTEGEIGGIPVTSNKSVSTTASPETTVTTKVLTTEIVTEITTATKPSTQKVSDKITTRKITVAFPEVTTVTEVEKPTTIQATTAQSTSTTSTPQSTTTHKATSEPALPITEPTTTVAAEMRTTTGTVAADTEPALRVTEPATTVAAEMRITTGTVAADTEPALPVTEPTTTVAAEMRTTTGRVVADTSPALRVTEPETTVAAEMRTTTVAANTSAMASKTTAQTRLTGATGTPTTKGHTEIITTETTETERPSSTSNATEEAGATTISKPSAPSTAEYLTSPSLHTNVTTETEPTTSPSPKGPPPRFIYCPPDKMVYSTREDVVVYWREPRALDFDFNPVETSTAHPSGSVFQAGESTQVTYTAEDKAGQQNTCSFRINVASKKFSCHQIKTPLNGKIQCKIIDYKLVCEAVCDAGYVLNPEMTRVHTCNTVTWSPRVPDGFETQLCRKKASTVNKNVAVTLELDSSCEGDDFGRRYSEALVLTMREVDKCNIDGADVGLCETSSYTDNCVSTSRRRKRQAVPAEIKAYLADPYGDDDPAASKDFQQKARDRLEEISKLLKQNGLQYGAKSVQAQSLQQKCPPGQMDVGDDCVLCPSGGYYNGKEGKCMMCGVNTYQPQEGKSQCLPCRANLVSPAGSYTSSQCVPQPPRPSTSTTAPPSGGGGLPLRDIIIIVVVCGLVVLILFAIPGICACRRVCCKRGEMDVDIGKSSIIYGSTYSGLNGPYKMQPYEDVTINGSVIRGPRYEEPLRGSRSDLVSNHSHDRYSGVMPARVQPTIPGSYILNTTTDSKTASITGANSLQADSLPRKVQSEIITSTHMEPQYETSYRTEIVEPEVATFREPEPEPVQFPEPEPEPEPLVIEAELTPRPAPVPQERHAQGDERTAFDTSTTTSSENAIPIGDVEEPVPYLQEVTDEHAVAIPEPYAEPVPDPVLDPATDGVTLTASADEPPLIVDTKPRKMAAPPPPMEGSVNGQAYGLNQVPVPPLPAKGQTASNMQYQEPVQRLSQNGEYLQPVNGRDYLEPVHRGPGVAQRNPNAAHLVAVNPGQPLQVQLGQSMPMHVRVPAPNQRGAAAPQRSAARKPPTKGQQIKQAKASPPKAPVTQGKFKKNHSGWQSLTVLDKTST